MDRETVKVYVRAGDHEGERTLSFRPPKEIRPSEWLKRGFAIDGNSVIASVTSTTYVADGQMKDFAELQAQNMVPGAWAVGWSLAKALHDVERWLVQGLDEIGYDVEFA